MWDTIVQNYYTYTLKSICKTGEISSVHYTNVNLLVLIQHYRQARYSPWGKLGEGCLDLPIHFFPQHLMNAQVFQNKISSLQLKKKKTQTSLVVQWLRIHLPTQSTWVHPCSRKIPHAMGQLSPWATTPEPTLRHKTSHHYEKSKHCKQRVVPSHRHWRKPECNSKDPEQPKINNKKTS